MPESESEVAQSCPTLCDPVDCSPPGSSIHGILQARTLEWVAISFSKAWKWKVKVKSRSRVRLANTYCYSVTQSCLTLCDPVDCSPLGSSVPWDSPGKNTRVGCHFLLQGIFRTQGSNPGLLHCRQMLYHLSHQGSPFIVLGITFRSLIYFWINFCIWY